MLLEDIWLSLLNVATSTLVIEQVLALPKEKGIQVFTMLWDWQTNRNKSNAGELPRSTEQVCHIIHKHMLFMPRVTGRESGTPREDNVNHPKPVWLKPKENFTKVNFDAGNHKTTGEGSWGFVARTDEGEFIAAAAEKLRHLQDALQVLRLLNSISIPELVIELRMNWRKLALDQRLSVWDGQRVAHRL
jgi:hypothetical protein